MAIPSALRPLLRFGTGVAIQIDGPKGSDPVGLALWLAETLSATALVVHGSVAVPAGSRVPVRRG